MQEKVNKVLTTQGMSISILTKVPKTGDAKENLISIASVGTTFMKTNEDNIQRLCSITKRKKKE
jgi:hypothetical protein